MMDGWGKKKTVLRKGMGLLFRGRVQGHVVR